MNKLLVFILFFFFISGTFATSFTPVSASELVADSWNTKTPSPNPERQAFEVVAVEGKIYAIGGFYYTETPYQVVGSILVENYLGTNECYDPVTDTWTTLEPMPTPRVGFTITSYQGKIYCIGSSHMYNCVVEVYDPATNSWSTKADLPVPPCSRNLQAHVADGKIFVRHVVEMYEYNSNKDSWIKKTQIPNIDAWYPIISVMVDEKIICFCVDEHDYPYNRPANVDVVIYDPKTDKWSEGKTQEIGFLEVGAWSGIMAAGVTTGVYAPKNVYVLGFKEGQYITWVYNPTDDVWSTAKTMSNMGVYGVVAVDDVLYVFGHTANGEVHMQYVPIGYNPLGYQTSPTATTPVTSEDVFSSGFFEPFWNFLTEPIVVAIVLTVGVTVIVLLFFYLRGKKVKWS
jgi:N-acetylneuraminic acid mutarotase